MRGRPAASSHSQTQEVVPRAVADDAPSQRRGRRYRAREIYVAVPPDRSTPPVRCFGTFTAQYGPVRWVVWGPGAIYSRLPDSANSYLFPIFCDDLLQRRGQRRVECSKANATLT